MILIRFKTPLNLTSAQRNWHIRNNEHSNLQGRLFDLSEPIDYRIKLLLNRRGGSAYDKANHKMHPMLAGQVLLGLSQICSAQVSKYSPTYVLRFSQQPVPKALF